MTTSPTNSRTKIQILVAAHQPSFIPENKYLKGIGLGAALSDQAMEGVTFEDNQGVNISTKNKSYSELTATYWAWKNLEADYYGIMHYRRYFNFSEPDSQKPYVRFKTILQGKEKIGISETEIASAIEGYDLIVPRQADTRIHGGDASLYDQYKKNHFIKDLDDALAYVAQKYPEIAEFNRVVHESKGYFLNMLIASKEIFDQYCTFLFDVLLNFETNHDIEGYNPQQYRVLGYIGERLTDIFIHYIKAQGKYRIRELQVASFENTAPLPKIRPAFSEDNIPIVLPTNDFYMPYVSTLLHSLVTHSSPDNHYDVNIFNRDVTLANQNLLTREFASYPNVSIRFVDMSPYAHLTDDLFETHVIPMETYFRLFIPSIMTAYDKVLYLDDDMVIKHDVAELFSEDLGDHLLGAVLDIDMVAHYQATYSAEADNNLDPNRANYLENGLKLKNPNTYFQAGVLLLNLVEMRKAFSLKELLEYSKGRWLYQDQDILNHFAQGRVKFIDWRWNVQYDWKRYRIKYVYQKAPHQIYEAYMKSRKDPYIIHFSGSIKPWHDPNCDFGEEFWEVARQSYYYEIILSHLIDTTARNKSIEAVEWTNYTQLIGRKFVRLGQFIKNKFASSPKE